MRTNFAIQESKNMKIETNRIQKYEVENLKEMTTKLKYLK